MRQKVSQLDGVRGVAILLVMFHNASGKFPALHLQGLFANAWMGVDLFFVLSGFLITGILIDTKQSERYLGNFYAGRCLRIWPFILFPDLFYVCSSSLPQSLGRKSPFGMVEALRLDRYLLLVMPTILLASYAAAALSWHLLGKPFLRLKRFFESKPVRKDRADNPFAVVPH